MWCDKDNNNELFASIPFSYGTFGFLTAVDIDIIPYKPFVKHTYFPTKSLKESVNLLEELSNDPEVDTVEGIVYSENESVIMRGKFVDDTNVSLWIGYFIKCCNSYINHRSIYQIIYV